MRARDPEDDCQCAAPVKRPDSVLCQACLGNLRHDAAPRCNCESAACDHDAAACPRPADPAKRLMYVGAVCAECHERTPARYRLSST